MNFKPLKMDSLTREQLNLNNSIVQISLSEDIIEPSGEWSFKGFQRVKQFPQSHMVLTVEVNDQSVGFILDVSDAAHWLSPWLHGVSVESLPATLTEAAVETAFNSVKVSIEKFFQCKLNLKEVKLENILLEKVALNKMQKKMESNPSENDEDDDVVLLKTDLTIGAQSLEVFARTSKSQLVEFSNKYLHKTCNEIDFPLSLNLSYGSTQLSVTDVETIESGDIVFFDECFYEKQQFLLSIGRVSRWLVQLNNEQLVIVSEWNLSMNSQELPHISDDESMNEKHSNIVQGSDASLASLSITLDFELPKHQLSLEEVKSLGEGYVFDLQANPDSAVSIVINGKKVGLGELVSVEDKLGVRISRWNKNGG